MMTKIEAYVARWKQLPRLLKAQRIIRACIGVMLLITGVAALGTAASPNSGVSSTLIANFGSTVFYAYGGVSFSAGVALLLLWRVTLFHFFLLTLPILTWVLLSWENTLEGHLNPIGSVFITCFYGIILTIYWGYDERMP